MSDLKYGILGIGNAVVDIISEVDISFINKCQLKHGAMTLVDLNTSKIIQEKIKNKKFQAGGSVANTISGMAKLGKNCAFIGKRKRDKLGKLFLRQMDILNIHVHNDEERDGDSTASCIVLVTPEGERTMCTHLGVSTQLKAGDIKENVIKLSEIIYLEGYLFDLPEAKGAFEKAAFLAKKHNRKISLSLSDPFCVDRHRESFLKFIYKNVDVLFANELEIRSLFKADSLNVAFKQANVAVETLVVTRGASGVSAYNKNNRYDMKAIKTKVVDTTGAGDLFAAGFLTMYLNKLGIIDCMKAGNICASEVIKDYGARPRKNLKKILEKNNFIFNNTNKRI